MQFQADIMGRTIVRPMIRETTALGAAYLAGLATGLWRDRDDIRSQWTLDRRYTPAMDPAERSRLLRGWSRAVERAKHWAD
jgi:glycerol kinase